MDKISNLAGLEQKHGQHCYDELYLSGKHGEAVAIFTIIQQEAESRDIVKFFELETI